ncbi:hypothetical protein GBA52_007254 [Prunus armeniaca]|nr:hypothetical protein GBA52_007254 [Prunus armeniaca]
MSSQWNEYELSSIVLHYPRHPKAPHGDTLTLASFKSALELTALLQERATVAIAEDCCKAIVEADDDCASTVFSQFNNHFFQMLLKQQCSNKEGHASTIATKGNTGTSSTESNTITTKVVAVVGLFKTSS